MNRRTFVKLIGTATPVMAMPTQLFADDHHSPQPIVISTWKPNQKANAKAWEVLQAHGTALDAVHQGVMVPEADPEDHSVGLGGLPDRDGHVTCDACIMDHHANIGSVMCLEHIVHSISVARMVMEKTPHVQLVGEGALQFALLNGFKRENLLTTEASAIWKKWMRKAKYDPMITVHEIEKRIKANHDTVGMIALDEYQNLSGACTTSGMAFKLPGRVGDSPIIGAGLYVDNEIGAATATGIGEEVVRICGSHTIVEGMRYGLSPKEACKKAIERLIKIKGVEKSKEIQLGFIAINKAGEIGCYSMLPEFTMAVHSAEGPRIIQSDYFFESTSKDE